MQGRAYAWKLCLERAKEEVSAEHPMKCVCGRLSSGMHEQHCIKFAKSVKSRAERLWKRLGYDLQYGDDEP